MGRVKILLVIFTIIWGFNLIAIKIINEQGQPITITGLRLLIAGFIITIYLYWKKQFQKISRNQGIHLFWICITGMVLHHLLLGIGITLTTGVHATLIMAFSPLTTSILAFFILHDRLTKMKISGIMMGLAGVFLIIYKDMASFSLSTGDLLIFGAMFFQSLSLIFIKTLPGSISNAYATSLLLTGGGLAVTVIGWFIEDLPIMNAFQNLSIGLLFIFLLSALLATAIGSVIWNQSVRVLGPGTASVFLNTVPFYSIFAAFIILNEKVYMYHVMGLLLVVSGVVLGTTPNGKDLRNRFVLSRRALLNKANQMLGNVEQK